jgi:copper chaperone NosL
VVMQNEADDLTFIHYRKVMKSNLMTKWTRLAVAICGLVLIVVLFFPMWRIELIAPQYPEGLVLLIYPDKLGGNVEIINGLNHYIGMKPLHAEDFIEFKILRYIVIFFAILLLLVAWVGRKRFLQVAFFLFAAFGVVAMIDFWKWEYNYGHNLNPDAAIIVPGMAYQPPLIGYKQLLNFQAFSIPGIGGWLFIAVGVTLFLLVASGWYSFRKRSRAVKAGMAVTSLMIVFLTSCNSGPEPILVGTDHCEFCKMNVSDNRFGGEIITRKGKLYKFDDIHCLLSFIQSGKIDRTQVQDVYLTDFSGNHRLLKSADAVLLQSDMLRAPMGGNMAAFSNPDSLQVVASQYKGAVLHWNDVLKP